MTDAVECQLCHKPIRSQAATARRIGSRCWRKLAPGQRAAMRALLADISTPSAGRVRAVLNRTAPAADGQLPLTGQDEVEL